MDILILIVCIVVAIMVTFLIISNAELRKENIALYYDNNELYHKANNATWKLEKTSNELKLLKAEYNIK